MKTDVNPNNANTAMSPDNLSSGDAEDSSDHLLVNYGDTQPVNIEQSNHPNIDNKPEVRLPNRSYTVRTL